MLGNSLINRQKMIHCETNIRKFLAVIPLIFLVIILFSCTVQLEQDDTTNRLHSLNKEIMCPVCPGESIDQSQNPLAVQMRNLISEQIERGWSDAQIKDFFVDRYGPRVLMSPPSKGFGLWAWIIPPSIVIVAFVSLVYVLRRMYLAKKHVTLSDDGNDQSDYAERVTKSLEPKFRRMNDMEKTIGD